MKIRSSLPLAIVAVVILSACGQKYDGPKITGNELSTAQNVAPQGSLFARELYRNYLNQAEFEVGQNDRHSIIVFANRAITTGGGAVIDPEEIAKRDLPAANVGELTNARNRLIAAIGPWGGGKEKQPALSAVAQVKFDCWMEQQEENVQQNHIDACKLEFEEAMKNLEAALAPKQMAAPMPKPMPPLMAVPGPYIIYFDFDSFDLTDAAQAIISEAAAAAKAAGVDKATLSGHTDRAGNVDYNKGLSKARVVAAGNALIEQGGTTRKTITKDFYGENNPRVATADDQREAQNRRVEIRFER